MAGATNSSATATQTGKPNAARRPRAAVLAAAYDELAADVAADRGRLAADSRMGVVVIDCIKGDQSLNVAWAPGGYGGRPTSSPRRPWILSTFPFCAPGPVAEVRLLPTSSLPSARSS